VHENAWESAVRGNQFNTEQGVESKGKDDVSQWNWGIDRIDSIQGIDNRYTYGMATGKGTYLYALDSGVYINHSDFGGRAVGGYSAGCESDGKCAPGWLPKGVITEAVLHGPILPQFGTTCDGHGTHTASTAAGTQYGVAKEANIIVAQSLNITGGATNKQVLKAVDWCIQDRKAKGNPPAVMTLSLGGDHSEFLNEIGRSASAHGFVVVAASGNKGVNSCMESPACEPVVLSVGAVDSSDHYAPYSNHGPCTDLFAPGSAITAAYPNKNSRDATATESGTSMATPHVAGAALQILQHHPDFTAEEATRALLCMATKNQIKGLDAHSPNLLLKAGDSILDPHNVQLIKAQRMPKGGDDSVSFGDGVTASTKREGEVAEMRLAGGDMIDTVRYEAPNADATRCFEAGHGPAKGYVVPAATRVQSSGYSPYNTKATKQFALTL